MVIYFIMEVAPTLVQCAKFAKENNYLLLLVEIFKRV